MISMLGHRGVPAIVQAHQSGDFVQPAPAGIENAYLGFLIISLDTCLRADNEKEVIQCLVSVLRYLRESWICLG